MIDVGVSGDRPALAVEIWQLREDHEVEVRAILGEVGALDAQGRVRRWDGEVAWSALGVAGHTSLDFDRCGCRDAWRSSTSSFGLGGTRRP